MKTLFKTECQNLIKRMNNVIKSFNIRNDSSIKSRRLDKGNKKVIHIECFWQASFKTKTLLRNKNHTLTSQMPLVKTIYLEQFKSQGNIHNYIS